MTTGATDIAIIGLGVETAGLKEGRQELDNLADAADKTEKAVGSMKGTFRGLWDEFKAGVREGAESVKAQQGMVRGLVDEFKAGLNAGMAQALQEFERSNQVAQSRFADRVKVAQEAVATINGSHKSGGFRMEAEIKQDIAALEQAYRDLQASGVASFSDLYRAKQQVLEKVRELKSEASAFGLTLEDIAKNAGDLGRQTAKIGTGILAAAKAPEMALKYAPKALGIEGQMQTEESLYGVAGMAGITKEESGEAVKQWDEMLGELAKKTNQRKQDLMGGFSVLVMNAMDPTEALATLESIANAATASGASVNDMASALFAGVNNLKLPVEDARKALDAMTAAGNRGSFELRDMAHYFPMLTAVASQFGMEGTKGMSQLAAAAQVAKNASGSVGQATTNLADFLGKLNQPAVVTAFKKFKSDAYKDGVDIVEEVKRGVASGDLIGYMGDLLRNISGGDANVVAKLFGDKQARMFALQLMKDLELYKDIAREAMNAEGAVERQKATVMQSLAQRQKTVEISIETGKEQSSTQKVMMDAYKSLLDAANSNPETIAKLTEFMTKAAAVGESMIVVGTAFYGISKAVAGFAAAKAGIAAVISFITVFAAALATPAGAALLSAVASALAVIAGTIAAFKVSSEFGDWTAEQIDKIIVKLTGEEGATLGAKLYDWIEGPEGIIAKVRQIPELTRQLWDDVKQAGVDLAEAFREGFRFAVKKAFGLKDKIMEMLAIVKETLKDWIKVGEEMLLGLWEGMKAQIRKPIEAIKQLAKDLPDWAKKLLDIRSPSGVFKEIGEFVGLGLAEGVSDSKPVVLRAASELAETLNSVVTANALAPDELPQTYFGDVVGASLSALADATNKPSIAPTSPEIIKALQQEAAKIEAFLDPMNEYWETIDHINDLRMEANLSIEAEIMLLNRAGKEYVDLAKKMKNVDEIAVKTKKESQREKVLDRWREGASAMEIAKEFDMAEDAVRKLINRTSEADAAMGKLRLTFESAFDRATDSFAEFIRTGKMNFKSFTDEITRGLAQMAAEQLMRPIKSGASSFVESVLGDVVGFLFNGNGNAFNGGSIAAFSSGGILGPRGGVLDRPTVFPMASGGIGIGGEAGTEAVLPLRRSPSGDLGVVSSGGGNVVVNVVESPGRGGEVVQRNNGQTRVVDVMVDQIKTAVSDDILRGGVVGRSIERTYGVNRSAGAY